MKRGFTLTELVQILALIGFLIMFGGGIIYVVIHFLGKVW